jgi:hypothetical protein
MEGNDRIQGRQEGWRLRSTTNLRRRSSLVSQINSHSRIHLIRIQSRSRKLRIIRSFSFSLQFLTLLLLPRPHNPRALGLIHNNIPIPPPTINRRRRDLEEIGRFLIGGGSPSEFCNQTCSAWVEGRTWISCLDDPGEDGKFLLATAEDGVLEDWGRSHEPC